MSCLEEPHVIGLSDSGQLVGIVSKPGNGRYPAVVMLHGFTGHHIESSRLYVDLSRTICDNGFLTARFDYRGHGNSSGSFEDFDVDNALADAEAIMRYVMGLNNVDPTKMAMVGLSLGGFIAVKTYVKFKETIKALVLLAPALNPSGTSIAREIQLIARGGAAAPLNQLMVKGNYIYMGALRHKVDKALKLHSMNAMDMASEIAAPTLAIHNKDDEAVPCSQSAKFMVGIKSIYKKLITPEKGGHVFGDYELRMRVAEEVTEWLKAHVQ